MSSQVAAFADGPYAPILSAPVNIEGTDLSLATEILPAPPPVAFIRLPMNRRPGDLAKRPLPSFIPTSDPGSTYATHSAPTPMVTTTTGVSDDQGRRKRARLEKLPLNRASRSSTRYSISLAPASSPPPELLPPPIITPQPAGPSTGSRSSPASDDGALASEPLRLEDTPSLLTNKSKKGRPRKGKLDSKPDYAKTEDAGDPERNDDICACCSISHHASNASPLSHFLYCDGCTRSFHMGCLDPPIIDNEDMPPPDKDWFCPACSANKASLSKSPTIDSPFDHLIYEQGLQLPQVFSLPEDIKAYFKNIATGYQDAIVRQRQARIWNLFCKMLRMRIISCDYCNLHWHLDCLDPPMTVMPPPLKKWMCPNHADHVMPPRRSTKNPRIIEVKHPGTRNNGNIEIIPSAEDLAKETVPYDEIYINNRRYLIPEKAIRLDFLQKMLLQISKGLRSLAFANGPDQSLSDFVHSIFSDRSRYTSCISLTSSQTRFTC
ncbi:uncharacterized protein EI90DRAFT_1942623 [Cantharellus anzutake]|uniref:uncharacterized protein n=1 Tax=Cantharellus anzutake TaxID=1750568 RepID=UPI001904D1B5|nr:uncharacterized protein EI90DRAFT_1942623 [Cantharellus anzutake]KAF8326348.1 hypothetical protein EI90DRAFT_1942623 [Cantharellus anzutake]